MIENKINDFDQLSQLVLDNEEIFKYIQKNKDYSLLDDLLKEASLTLKLSEKIRYLNLLKLIT